MSINRTLIIAELSANLNNDFELAVDTLKAIASAGADAVKIQTFKPESLTLDLDDGFFSPRTSGLWKGLTPWQVFQTAAMPYEWQPKLKEIAEELGLEFFSSPFDSEGVDFLESIHVPRYKIASAEINDLPLIRKIALTRKPIIISTGLATIDDIQEAVDTCHEAGNLDITLLKCTSQYPAAIEDANLATIPHMKNHFGVNVGVSDHTMGHVVPMIAVSLGATVVEKHFTLNRELKGPDSAFSLEPREFKRMVDAIRQTELALGSINYDLSESDRQRRRSLFVIRSIDEGELLSSDNIRSIRPGNGLSPNKINEVLGKVATRKLDKGTPLKEDDFR